MRILLIFLTFVATPAFATNGCHDLWFTRNLIMDRAGFCFGSALGQAVFDNSDCTGKTVELTRSAISFVKRIQREEKMFGCKVDTTRTVLDIEDLAIRRRLKDLPLRDELESACLGWLGPETPLYDSHSTSGNVIGRITSGDTITFSFWSQDNWSYLLIHTPDWSLKSGGWSSVGIPSTMCRDFAG